MTLLYPRLLGSKARLLFEEFATIDSPGALTGRASPRDEASVYVATGGARATEERLENLAVAVRALAQHHGFPDRPGRPIEFDISLARLLHSTMDIAPAEAASRDVWTFLSLVLLPDVSYWRFPTPPSDRVLNTDITRHVFGRLWWRAELVFDPSLPDPYEALSILGEADFDQVYARRAAIGASPRVVRNLLLVWRDLRARGELVGVSDREAFRSTLMNLLRVVPFLSLNALEDEALVVELRRSARQAIEQHRSRPPTHDGRVHTDDE